MSAFDAKKLFAWLDQIATDPKLSGLAVKVAYGLSQYGRKTGEAFPMQETLAADLQVTERGVRGAVSELVKTGHLVKSRVHKRAVNSYTLYLLEGNNSSPQPSWRNNREGNNSSRQNAYERNRGSSQAPFERNYSSSRRKPSPSKDGEGVGCRPPGARLDGAPDSASPAGFDDLWRQWPRREKEQAARTAYERALRQASRQDILAGALRFLQANAGRDPTYIPYLATWLKDGRWREEPAKRARTNGTGQTKRGKTSLAEEALRAGGWFDQESSYEQ